MDHLVFFENSKLLSFGGFRDRVVLLFSAESNISLLDLLLSVELMLKEHLSEKVLWDL